jgi:hypothetical protein
MLHDGFSWDGARCGNRHPVGKWPNMVSLVPMKVGNVYENS